MRKIVQIDISQMTIEEIKGLGKWCRNSGIPFRQREFDGNIDTEGSKKFLSFLDLIHNTKQVYGEFVGPAWILVREEDYPLVKLHL